MTSNRKTEAQARASLAAMEPIMAIEGRNMSKNDKELLVAVMRGTKSLDDVRAALLHENGFGTH